jgi:hypothetical protein
VQILIDPQIKERFAFATLRTHAYVGQPQCAYLHAPMVAWGTPGKFPIRRKKDGMRPEERGGAAWRDDAPAILQFLHGL